MSPDRLPVFYASDRIRQLNSIDQDVAKLLKSAGLAVEALTTPTVSASAGSLLSQPVPIERQRESFTAATSQYFTLLSSVDVSLRRQIYALEEADILPAEAISKEPPKSQVIPSAAQVNPLNASASKIGGGTKGVIAGGGLGNFDVGWLNSRNDNVGKEMNAQLWGEAEGFVSNLKERKLDVDRGLAFFKGDDDKEGANAVRELDDSGQFNST